MVSIWIAVPGVADSIVIGQRPRCQTLILGKAVCAYSNGRHPTLESIRYGILDQ